MPTASVTTEPRSDKLLKTIAAFKFVKALALVVAGLAAWKMLDPAFADWVADWADDLPLRAEQHVANQVISWISGQEPRQIKELGLAAFLFAGIFSVEGVGLWLGKAWAEWFAVVATSLFIPVEIYELCDEPSASKAFAFVLNIVVVAYLIFRIKRNKH